MNFVIFLVLCLGTSWAQETQNDVARTASERARQISRDASARANQISQGASVRANTVQYYQPPMYGGGYGYGGYSGNWGQPQPLYHISQEGAVAIGERVSPPNEIFRSAIDCVKELGNDKDTQKFCKDVAQKTLKETGNVSRSARKAVPRPAPILLPRWGW